MKNSLTLYITCILLLAISCTEEKQYQYEVNPVSVGYDGTSKTHRKTTTEFISIAYTDLFGTTIPQSKLNNLSVVYSSFGDLKVIEERIISNFLNDTNAVIPPQVSVNGDTVLFITNTYKKLFNRQPNEFEKQRWKQMIQDDASVTPATIYFSMMTSDEYRFY